MKAFKIPKLSKDRFMRSSKEILTTQVDFTVHFPLSLKVFIMAQLIIPVENLVRSHQPDEL